VRWLQRGYIALLARVIPRPLVAYVAVITVMAAGAAVVPLLGQNLFPAFKERDFLMHWVTRPGTSHPDMIRITTQASKELRSIPGVKNFGAHIGQGTLADEIVGMNFAENWISIDPSVNYDKTVAAIKKVVEGYPGLQRDVQTYLKERTKEVLTGTSEAIIVRIFGDDHQVLREKAEQVRQIMSEISGIIEEHVDLQVDIPQMQVEVDLAKASTYGIKPGDVRRAVATFIASEEAGDIWRGGKNYEVHVWSVPEARNSLENVRELLLDAPYGRRVRLGDLAEVVMRPTPNVVVRENQSRRLDVGANVSGRDLGSVAREVERRLQEVQFPIGYHAELLGEYKEAQAAQQRLLIFAGVAVLGILLLLQNAFGSWRMAILVLLTLPMALVGGVLAAFFTGGVVSLGSLVGFFTVLGIAARNGIPLINHFQHLERYEGETFGWALVIRGAKERLSPILMTSLAAGLALVPLVILGSRPGHEVEHPMAVVILGGLVTSTLLNLFVVPSLYLRYGGRRRSPAPPHGGPPRTITDTEPAAHEPSCQLGRRAFCPLQRRGQAAQFHDTEGVATPLKLTFGMANRSDVYPATQGWRVSMTVRERVALFVAPAFAQVTVTGQSPGVVLVPTSHVQATSPVMIVAKRTTSASGLLLSMATGAWATFGAWSSGHQRSQGGRCGYRNAGVDLAERAGPAALRGSGLHSHGRGPVR
jgi:Cu/Ag efflux pump CusA